MGVRQFIRPDVAASAIAHLSVLGLVIFFAEVHPYGAVTAEPIKVDIVTAEQLKQAESKLEQTTPFPITDSLTKDDIAAGSAKSASATSAESQKAGAPQQQKETSPQKKEARRESAAQQKPQPAASPQPPQPTPQPQAEPQPQSQPAPQQQSISPLPMPEPQTQSQPPPAPASSLGYAPPEPDVTVKYHVVLGLPPALPPAAPGSSSGDKPGDGVDATASRKADIASSLIGQFRERLKSCSKLPASLSPSDNVRIKLRVQMRPDGTLAAEPILIEGTASMKGLDMKQSAVNALVACQPYVMLPPDRYGEWKVLDLSFTPDDFTS
jgi:outer membrane biosynthesis protein TonB